MSLYIKQYHDAITWIAHQKLSDIERVPLIEMLAFIYYEDYLTVSQDLHLFLHLKAEEEAEAKLKREKQ
jgi:hypothetical protein